MSKVNFSDYELRKMKEFYEDELVRAQEKVNHIKDVLSKLGSSLGIETARKTRQTSTAADLTVKTEKVKPVKEKAAKPAKEPKGSKQTASKDKSGRRKSQWTAYLIDSLTSANRFVPTNQIIDNALNQFKFTGNKAVTLRNTLQATLFRLSKENVIQTYRIKGEKTSYWAVNSVTELPVSQKQPVIKPEKVKKDKESKKASAGEGKRNSKWTSFIVDYLNSSSRFFTTDEVINAGLKAYKLTPKEKDTAKNTLQATLHRLNKEGNIQTYRIKGVKTSFWSKNGVTANEKTVTNPKA